MILEKLVKKKARRKKKEPTPLKKADDAFSWYIRLRDSHNNFGVIMGACCTCDDQIQVAYWDDMGELKHNKLAQCGHFISRAKYNVRFDERNSDLQCWKCNCPKKGMQYEHSLYVDRKLGPGTALVLREEAKQQRLYKKFELLEIEEKYKKLSRIEEERLGL